MTWKKVLGITAVTLIPGGLVVLAVVYCEWGFAEGI